MKRISLFLVSIISAFTLSACTDDVVEERDVDPYDEEPGLTDPDPFDGDNNFDMPEDFDLPGSDEDVNRIPNYDTNKEMRDEQDRITDDQDETVEPENTVD